MLLEFTVKQKKKQLSHDTNKRRTYTNTVFVNSIDDEDETVSHTHDDNDKIISPVPISQNANEQTTDRVEVSYK